MTCPSCIEVPTLQSVHDSETAVYDEDVGEVPRDLVAEALTLTGGVYGSYADAVKERIWNDYRYRMLGTCDTDMFVRILGDRLTAEVYTAVAALDAVTAAGTDVAVLGGTRTVVRGQRTDTLTREREDMPDNFSDTYTYPSEKSKDTNAVGTQTDTETDGVSTAARLRDLMDALRDPLDSLMYAIRECWLNRW